MEAKELGPCPLCGGEAVIYDGGVFCSTADCDMGLYAFTEPTWNHLSTLAAQNRRRGEALEEARDWFRQPGYVHNRSAQVMADRCEEALKQNV